MSDNQFILLPARGLKGSGASTASQRNFFLQANSARATAGARMQLAGGAVPRSMRIIDSIHEDGAKLVELAPEALPALRAAQPGIRIVPLRYYEPARTQRMRLASSSGAAAHVTATQSWNVTVVDRTTKQPIEGVSVVAFRNFASRIGAEGTTDAHGRCLLTFDTKPQSVERLYAYARGGYWSGFREALSTSADYTVDLEQVTPASPDGLQFYYPTPAADSDGSGVCVGVVDTGVALTHPDLHVDGGANTVVGEASHDFGDNGEEGHGTHVAGIIAAHGQHPNGMRGLAPDVKLRSYRVFGQGQGQASNYAIAKAIDRAIADGCDLINLSLGGSADDEATRAAIEDANAQGVVVIAAAGNDGHQPVSYPAADPHAIAVTALGRLGTFPKDSVDMGDVGKPFGPSGEDYIALFSNIGPQVDLTAPGVAIVSTLPPATYGALSGTSMACPAVTGFAAKLLSSNGGILTAARDAARAEAIMSAMLKSAVSLELGPEYEGHGLMR